jgi:hypothetical protein
MKISALILLMIPIFSFAQSLEKDFFKNLKNVKSIPIICRSDINKLYFSDETKNIIETSVPLPKPVGCGDKAFWSIVKLKDKAIPLLIENLNDTTTTSIAAPYKPYNYSIADLSLLILKEIIHDFPAIASKNNDQEYLRRNYKARVRFKQQISIWYNNNINNLVWTKSEVFSTCDCQGPHPNGGHYVVKKKKLP